MTYSASDFADEVFAKLCNIGAITEAEAENEDLDDNASLQADYAIAGISRLDGIASCLNSLLVKYGQLIESADMANAREALGMLDISKRDSASGKVDPVLPAVVIRMEGGVIHDLQSSIPVQVIFLDQDTEGGDPENIKTVDDEEFYVIQASVTSDGEIVTAPEYVAGVLSQLEPKESHEHPIVC